MHYSHLSISLRDIPQCISETFKCMAIIVYTMAGNTPEQGDGGRWQARVTIEDVLDVFETVEGPPVITSNDVSSALDCSGDTARNKLNTLFGQRQVEKREAGRTTLWWRPADLETVSEDE